MNHGDRHIGVQVSRSDTAAESRGQVLPVWMRKVVKGKKLNVFSPITSEPRRPVVIPLEPEMEDVTPGEWRAVVGATAHHSSCG